MSDTRFGEGPYHLTVRSLACNVGRNGPGAFLLGEQTEDGFVAAYAGRSDTDVSARLQGQVGKYRHFLFAYTVTAGAAFEHECNLYHSFQPDHNRVHPVPRPEGDWCCPRCNSLQIKAA